MSVRNAELHAGQAAGPEAAEELAPERLGFALADVDADHLAAAGLVDAVGDHQALLPHFARLADPLDLRVEPQVGVAGVMQRPLAERRDLLIEPLAEPADLVLAHRLNPELLHEPLDFPGRDPVDVRLLHDRDECLLRPLARLEKRREVRGPGSQLRDREVDLPGPRLPAPSSVAVALS